jgi:phospholipase C
MTEFALRNASTNITLRPGQVRSYRLPVMSPGEFHIAVTSIQPIPVPPKPHPMGTPHAAGGHQGGIGVNGSVVVPVDLGPLTGGVSPPVGSGTGAVAQAQSGDLLIDLFHGDSLVATGIGFLPIQQNIWMGDGTWRVRFQMAQGTTDGDYPWRIDLMPYTSMLPIQTRRIPLEFFQDFLDLMWNGNDYVRVALEGGQLAVRYDPDVASYYGLKNLGIQLFDGNSSFFTGPQLQTKDISVGIDSSSSGYQFLNGPQTYVYVTVNFAGINGQPIEIDVLTSMGLKVQNFSVTVKFYLTTIRSLTYVTQVVTDLKDQIRKDSNGNGAVGTSLASSKIDSMVTVLQQLLDQHSVSICPRIVPWLLGAHYDIWRVRYDPISTSGVGAKRQGDLVIDYVAPAQVADAATTSIAPDHLPLVITTVSLEPVVAGTVMSQTIATLGGASPVGISLSGSQLPAGLSLVAGVLTGTTSATGLYAFTATATDAAGQHVSRDFLITVNAPGLQLQGGGAQPRGVLFEPFGARITAHGGVGQVKWSASGLPPGLSINMFGVITGTPSAGQVGVQAWAMATDAAGHTAKVPLVFAFDDPMLFDIPTYAPRGAGTGMWQAPAAVAPLGGGHVFPVLPPTTLGDLSKIDHVVILMMENRSFDQMLGYLSLEGGRDDVEGLKFEVDGQRTQFNYYAGRQYLPHHLTDTWAIRTEGLSPDHSHAAVRAQIMDGMGHFVSNYAKKQALEDPGMLSTVMGYYGAKELPFYDLLARGFAVCDHWFCSHVGPSWPNRFVALTGDLNRNSYGEAEVDTPDFGDFTPSEVPTLFDHLSSRNVSWKYFQQRVCMMRSFTSHTFDTSNVVEYADAVKGFQATVLANQLPSVSWVDPLFGDVPGGKKAGPHNDDAPPCDLADGQKFVSDVVNTLFDPSRNPAWLKTMLVVVYDEHGGFYDHVMPPDNASPLLGQSSGRLGPRVPAMVVSAWTPPGLVLKDTFDHATIAATVLRRFCSPHPPYMGPRVAAAKDLRGALSLNQPRGLREPLFGGDQRVMSP